MITLTRSARARDNTQLRHVVSRVQHEVSRAARHDVTHAAPDPCQSCAVAVELLIGPREFEGESLELISVDQFCYSLCLFASVRRPSDSDIDLFDMSEFDTFALGICDLIDTWQ